MTDADWQQLVWIRRYLDAAPVAETAPAPIVWWSRGEQGGAVSPARVSWWRDVAYRAAWREVQRQIREAA